MLRAAGVRLQDSRGPRRAQRAGLHVTTYLGGELRGKPAILPGMVGKFTWEEMAAWYAEAVAALRAAGHEVVEPNGSRAMCCVVL
jgi:hypothetical protein